MAKKKKSNAVTKAKKQTVKKNRSNAVKKVRRTKPKRKEKSKKPVKLVSKSVAKNSTRKTNTKTKGGTRISGTKRKGTKSKQKKKSVITVKTVTRKKNTKGENFKRNSKTVVFEFTGKSFAEKTEQLFSVLKEKIKYALYANKLEPIGLFVIVAAQNVEGQNFQVYKTAPEFVVNMKNTVGFIKQIWDDMDNAETFSKATEKSDAPIKMKFSKNIIRLEIVFIY